MTEHPQHPRTKTSTVAVACHGYTTVSYFEDWSSATKYATFLRDVGYITSSIAL